MMQAFFSKRAGMIILAAFVVACSQQKESDVKPMLVAGTPAVLPGAASVSAATPSEAPALSREHEGQLMRAIFQDNYDSNSGNAVVDIRQNGTDSTYLMALVCANELADGRTAVIVNGSPSDQNGADMSAHVTPGMLNVYTVRREDGDWTVLERRENVASVGSHGQIGSVKWINLSPNKQGFIVSSGGVWQGYEISMADVFDLGDGVRHLGGFREMSGNSGACMPEVDECWEIDSSMRFVDSPQPAAYRDILVDFKGKRYKVTENKSGDFTEHLKANIEQSARYHFDGKKYVLVSGTNPVPSI
ncbi:hypothetical protein [Massilia horti]|uniref:Uncharacterized protein n=1 Tax=Massilia horti TaxID=2562153 RepID=A0A4Y9T2G7_9BURK|nr:hypothetical protein [Massilia horti]TFW33726.1 hypothetical protein E4O92_05900 [Massilia horti]